MTYTWLENPQNLKNLRASRNPKTIPRIPQYRVGKLFSYFLKPPQILPSASRTPSHPYIHTCLVGTCGGAKPWAVRHKVFYHSDTESQRAAFQEGCPKAQRQQAAEYTELICVLDLTLLPPTLGSLDNAKDFCDLASITSVKWTQTYFGAGFIMKNPWNNTLNMQKNTCINAEN